MAVSLSQAGGEHATGYDTSKKAFNRDQSLPPNYITSTHVLHSARDWQAVEGALSQDLVTLAAYL